uniref:NADH-ubiquinone oxidoreductase chain 6 n=1 Tax=Blanus cinereus TaxID=227091 RepID=B7SN21_BLACI|nr:NADH dehydrogenase subunit 6 [Blanus cinereus]ABZ79351.1 NADH dehygrogenase subunit 6 [Blanus cinereus]
MMYLVYFLSLSFLVAVVGVVINPLPQYGAAALVIASVFSCAILAWLGGSFLSIILLLIYLGGMLVVFAYAVALTSDYYLEGHGGFAVGVRFFVLVCIIMYVGDVRSDWVGSVWHQCVGVGEFGGLARGFTDVQVDLCGVPVLYCFGGVGLLLCVVCLFICLFIVLGLTRGAVRGGLRPF